MKSILEINGIKCDSCDYKDMSVQLKDYDSWLNKPCPICGENLLTEADYEMVKELSLLVDTQNKSMALNNSDEPRITATLEMNGSGNVEIKDLELEECSTKVGDIH